MLAPPFVTIHYAPMTFSPTLNAAPSVTASVPACFRWATAVAAGIVIAALAYFYSHSTGNSSTTCPGSHLTSIGWFIVAFYMYSILLPWAGHACCSAVAVKTTYIASWYLFSVVLSMWVPIEAFRLSCSHNGFLWMVVMVHGAICFATNLIVGVATGCALTRDLCREWQHRRHLQTLHTQHSARFLPIRENK